MKRTIQQPDFRKNLPLRLIAVSVFILCSLTFWGFIYKYNLYFREQLQLFLLSTDYFKESVSVPGGFSGYLGEFFTQFFHIPFAGALIITLLLWALQQITAKLIATMKSGDRFYLLSFIPAVWYSMALTSELYLVSGLVAIVIAFAFAWLYNELKSPLIRGISGITGLILVYFLTGGSYLLFLLVVVIFEWLENEKKKKDNRVTVFWLVALLVVALALPLFVKRFLIIEPLMQAIVSEHYYKIATVFPYPVLALWLAIPAIMLLVNFLPENKKARSNKIGLFAQTVLILIVAFTGFKLFTYMASEQIKGFDYYVRNKNWNQVIKLAEKDYPQNPIAVSYVNLALAKTGQLPNKMLKYKQIGSVGLFYPNNREYLTAMFGNEVFYELGLVNVSQLYVFESMESTPDLRKTVRAVKRLAETNLINGNYEVAKKYLHKLEQTLFYRKWANNAETYLYNEEKINSNPDWGEKRRLSPKQDNLFDVSNMEKILIASLTDNPKNKMAFEYLMAYYLLNRDLDGFMKFVPLAQSVGYSTLPSSYQEALTFVEESNAYKTGRETDSPMVSAQMKQKLRNYGRIYGSSSNPQVALRKDYGDTYWYYLHFR